MELLQAVRADETLRLVTGSKGRNSYGTSQALRLSMQQLRICGACGPQMDLRHEQRFRSRP